MVSYNSFHLCSFFRIFYRMGPTLSFCVYVLCIHCTPLLFWKMAARPPLAWIHIHIIPPRRYDAIFLLYVTDLFRDLLFNQESFLILDKLERLYHSYIKNNGIMFIGYRYICYCLSPNNIWHFKQPTREWKNRYRISSWNCSGIFFVVIKKSIK